ncbi:MAG: histidinol-phosphate transaminase [Acidobacteriota bacterium]
MPASAQAPASASSRLGPAARDLVRPEVQELGIYHLDLTPCLHKLDQNEVPYDLPLRQRRRAASAFAERSWARYPDFHADAVRQRLAERHGVPSEAVLVGNGSNELLGVGLEALVRPGSEVLGTLPSFGLYRMFVVRAGGVPRFLQARSLEPGGGLELPIAALEEEIERDPTRPVILCTPNNPTGDAVSPRAVERLLEKLEAPLLLDNAYGEFCRYDYRPLLGRYRHLVIFRTFSKAWSLGGLRLGYLLADPGMVHELMKVKLPYNIGLGHIEAACEVLDRPAAAERRTRAILARRPQWAAMFESFGYRVLPSEANFLLVRVGSRVADIRAGLETRGIRVRDVSKYPGLEGFMRVSVGSGRALRDVRSALAELQGEVAS